MIYIIDIKFYYLGAFFYTMYVGEIICERLEIDILVICYLIVCDRGVIDR